MNNSIQPTVELATTNGNNGFAYPYPVMYGNNGGFGNSGFLGGDGWIILLLLLAFGGWGNNGNGGFFNGNSFDNGYAWLSNGQKEIMQNTNNGFDTLHLSNQLDTINSGIYSLSNQLCNCCADMNSTVSNGFYNAEIGANNRQMANMNQIYGLSTQLATASADNRLASCQTQNAIVSEAAATRFADANNTRDIITSQTQGTQAILDKLCQLELDNVKAQLDAKNDRIADLQREISMKDLAASQVAQTAQLRLSEEQQFENFYNRLKNCPVNAVSVYGNQPVFSCPNNNGCGCNGFNNLI